MPSLSTLLLCVLSGVPADDAGRNWGGGPPRSTAQNAAADYQTAFGEPAEPAGLEPRLGYEQPMPAPRSGRLPIEFKTHSQVRRDSQFRPAAHQQPVPVRLTTAETQGAIPLPPPKAGGEATSRRMPTASVSTVVGSLAGVVGLFLIGAWLLRRGMPRGSSLLPRDVVEVLGRAPLVGRQQMHLLRLGNKLVLVSICAGAVETLAEVTDPLEVDRLTGLCYQSHPHGASASFRQVFESYEAPRPKRSAERRDLSQLDALALGKEAGHVR